MVHRFVCACLISMLFVCLCTSIYTYKRTTRKIADHALEASRHEQIRVQRTKIMPRLILCVAQGCCSSGENNRCNFCTPRITCRLICVKMSQALHRLQPDDAVPYSWERRVLLCLERGRIFTNGSKEMRAYLIKEEGRARAHWILQGQLAQLYEVVLVDWGPRSSVHLRADLLQSLDNVLRRGEFDHLERSIIESFTYVLVQQLYDPFVDCEVFDWFRFGDLLTTRHGTVAVAWAHLLWGHFLQPPFVLPGR